MSEFQVLKFLKALHESKVPLLDFKILRFLITNKELPINPRPHPRSSRSLRILNLNKGRLINPRPHSRISRSKSFDFEIRGAHQSKDPSSEFKISAPYWSKVRPSDNKIYKPIFLIRGVPSIQDPTLGIQDQYEL